MKFEPKNIEQKEVLENDKKEHKRIKLLLEKNREFNKLKCKHKKRIVEKGEWRLPVKYNEKTKTPSWIEIGINAGMKRDFAKEIYTFYSSYTHCDSFCIIQVRDAHNDNDRELLAGSALGIMTIIMAFMIKSYRNVFVECENVLREDNDKNNLYKSIIEYWCSEETKNK